MISAQIQSQELDQFNKVLANYISTSSRTTEQALAKKGNDFAWALSRRMKGLAPGKGAIRRERMAALKRGEGVVVRESVEIAILRSKGINVHSDGKFTFGKRRAGTKSTKIDGERKRLNVRALMVRRELALRESGTGFLSVVARLQNRGGYSIKGLEGGGALRHIGRANQQIASAGLTIDPNEAKLKIRLGSSQSTAGEGFSKAQQSVQIAAALSDVRKDMSEYLERKQLEKVRSAIRKTVR